MKRLNYARLLRLVPGMVVLACVMLPGCGIPQIRCPDPSPALPKTFPDTFPGVDGSESSAQTDLDTFFNDPVLNGLIQQAFVGNQELKILRERVQIANNEILARQGAILPFVDLGGRTGLAKASRFTP